MKRVKLIILLAMILLLSACSKSPKEEFISAFDSLNSEEYNAGKFEVSIPDIYMTKITEADQARRLSESFKNMSIRGDYQYNKDDESFRLDADAKAFGSTIPFEMVGKRNESYLSTSYLNEMLTFMDTIGRPAEVNQAQVNNLKGKYVAVDLKGMKVDKKVQNKMTEILKNAKEDSFKNSDDIISYTFNNKDVKKIINYFHLTEANEERLGNLTLTMKINKQMMKTDCIVKIQSSGQSMTVKAIINPSKKETAISMPKEQDIVPIGELKNIFEPKPSSGLYERNDKEVEKLTDEEFEMLYHQMEANLSEFDEMQRRSFLRAYSPYLNDEQVAKLKILISQETVQP